MDNGYGVISTGFNKKTFNDLKGDLEDSLKSSDKFGADIDFSDQDPMYHFSVPILEIGAELWELAEEVFYSASPKYAEGIPLKNTGKHIGIVAKQASKSYTIARFTGTPGTSIPAGFQIKTNSNIYFETTVTKLISSTGYIDINVEAVEAGADGDVPANTITTIVSPIIGLNSVTNPNDSIGGQNQETDIAYRDRYQESTAIGAGSSVDAIKAAILAVTDVKSAKVVENDELTTVDNVPAKSIFALVYGGSDDDVAKAIFNKKSGGIGTYGTTTVSITDSQGVTHSINFSRPTATSVYIKIAKTATSDYPSDGDSQIITAVKAYIDGLDVGETVKIYRITAAISALNLDGLTDIQVTLSTDGTTYNASNISIDADKIAVTTTDKIEVV